MTVAYVTKFGWKLRPTNIGIQKIDGLALEIYGNIS